MKYKLKRTGDIYFLHSSGRFYKHRLYRIPQEVVENSNEFELVQEIPEYVKCTKNQTSSYESGIIYPVNNDRIGNGMAFYSSNHNRFEPSTKEAYDKQELQNSIKNMKHGEWYKCININGFKDWLLKFDKIENGILYTLNLCGMRDRYIQKPINTSYQGWNINNIESISPATQQEVEQYFPNEFKKILFKSIDGVDIIDGMDYWACYDKTIEAYKYYNQPYHCKAPYPLMNLKAPGVFRFSTQQKAQEYLDSLKPKLDYEILSFRIKKGVFMYEPERIINQPFPGYTEKDYIGDNAPWSINSIKRLSDGEIFTIGNTIEHNSGSDKGIINQFYFNSIKTLIVGFIGPYHNNPAFQFSNSICVVRKTTIKEETLLEKAKRIYIIGIKVKSIYNNTFTHVLNGNIIEYPNGNIANKGICTLYLAERKEWAEIISESPVKLNTKEFKEQLFTKEQEEYINKLIKQELNKLC